MILKSVEHVEELINLDIIKIGSHLINFENNKYTIGYIWDDLIYLRKSNEYSIIVLYCEIVGWEVLE